MHILKNEQGVTLVFIGLLFFLMLLFLGVAVDIGWTTYARGQAQRRVDAAALAAGSALICPTTFPYNGYTDCASYRAAKTQARADLLAGASVNNVVNTSTNPANTVAKMKYNATSQTLTAASDWTQANCNAVQVSEAVPTPLFFSSIRNVFGASENGSMTVHVGATAYVGCPGAEKPPLPLGFCSSAINYPSNCNVAHGLQVPNGANNSGFMDPASLGTMSDSLCKALVNGTTTMPTVSTGTTLNLNNGQLTSCLSAIQTQYNTNKDASGKWCVVVPVVDNCSFVQSQPDSGFAMFCITSVITTGNPKYVDGYLQCPANFTGGPGGECFGTAAQSPVLVN